jgi:hypothetical protein
MIVLEGVEKREGVAGGGVGARRVGLRAEVHAQAFKVKFKHGTFLYPSLSLDSPIRSSLAAIRFNPYPSRQVNTTPNAHRKCSSTNARTSLIASHFGLGRKLSSRTNPFVM